MSSVASEQRQIGEVEVARTICGQCSTGARWRRCRLRITLTVLLPALFFACAEEGDAPVQRKGAAVTSSGAPSSITVTPTLCPSDQLNSSKTKPPASVNCPPITIPPPSATFVAKQQQYVAELAKKEVAWQGLSREQRDIEQLKLKRQILGDE